MPEEHPARQEHDTFYFNEREDTSTLSLGECIHLRYIYLSIAKGRNYRSRVRVRCSRKVLKSR
ncbi:MAG TPA: hypothetical protein EYP05_04965 [Piscirickettsiaceae bacterium]|nr:hypothetical protein [Piscirickettsiaceae bacterium]